MHTPIHQIRQDLLRRRTSFAQSPEFDPAYAHFLSYFSQFLLQEAGAYQSIAFCWPYRDELDLREPLREWRSSNPNRYLLLPKVRPDRQLSFYTWSDSDPLILNTYGIAEPDPTASGVQSKTPDCILIPCVGWLNYQNQYWRLGYGGGYFDRTIASLKQTGHRFTTIGIAFDWQALDLDRWTPEVHDQALDLVVTNFGIYRSSIKS
ncbi:5-formyltetrahydrofolate cyclo-ligase [Polynucleobacter sp. HIN7]|uniref:5-formyltetrahydrofolate cyclo-ligase n=1 Tax=Polynucleobacter sp. HIN7 TaxID=3047866 RepID=UPI002573A84D|nr:5-formyltetrahydrofolate cyclo-ligase [Polynucleobacter sp. HIN7]BEI38005.1 5-formyltetrahydrofolate cyclo-ligase [Polynucleobacter sp. HIN7]